MCITTLLYCLVFTFERFFVIELTFLIVPFCPLNFTFKDPVRVTQALYCCAQSVKVHSLWSLSHLSHHKRAPHQKF